MSIFSNLFSKKDKSDNEINIAIDFDNLVNIARNSGNVEDLNHLYKSFLELKEWNFIVSENCELENAKPFIGILDENPWLFIFTESEKGNSYAKEKSGFLKNNGNTLIIKMSVKNSINMIKQLHERGVYGIRINEGENGWFCTIPGLIEIISFLKIEIN
jgi:hypothetical protein